ncbi:MULTISPECIES: hypothetical protein [unclassified Afipia]|jgi:hypothetical protein|uniref:hypothetical protein n=1 Tax=unclassified Afipia TaxID=2642050 RepID=UPI00041E32D9|nr:hypothetical protein [Afipia sp.]WIG50391.1 MAG: hypothetical protein OJF48_001308 [Afipia sp.]
MTPAMPVTAVMVPVPMMPVMVADLLQFATCEIILICNRGLRGGVRLGLRAIHQILMRGQHRSSARCGCSGGDGSSAGGKAERKFQEITTFHFFISPGEARLQRSKHLAETMNVV